MDAPGKSTSVTLLYADDPRLDFAGYVDNLELVLRQSTYDRFDLRWTKDDFVAFDIDGNRIVLGYADLAAQSPAPGPGTPAGYACALVLSVGPGQRGEGAHMLADNGRSLCDQVIEHIQSRHGADLILWTEIEGVFTAEHFDSLVDTALTMRPAEALPAAASRFEEPQVNRLMDRLTDAIGQPEPAKSADPKPEMGMAMMDRAIHDRTAAAAPSGLSEPAAPAPSAPPAEPAANDAEPPHPMHAEMGRIRDALYPPLPERRTASGKEPTVRRLTLYTFNTTMLMVSLPVGAALLTYNILGREDSRVTARLMALTGIGVAFSKALLHGHLPHLGA